MPMADGGDEEKQVSLLVEEQASDCPQSTKDSINSIAIDAFGSMTSEKDMVRFVCNPPVLISITNTCRFPSFPFVVRSASFLTLVT